MAEAPAGFRTKAFRSKDIDGYQMTIQVAPDDCTGCGVCVDVCPAKTKTEVRHKAINMEPADAHREPSAGAGTSSSTSPLSTGACSRTTP